MNVQRWVARREKDWKRLDSILKKVESKGIKSLPSPEIKELASLYRSVSADLARAKTNDVGYIITQDLQKLTSRSYSQIYQGGRRQDWQGLINFCLWGFPEVLQETWIYTAISTALFLFGAAFAWWYAWKDPVFLSMVVPESLITSVRDEGKLWMGSILGVEPLASSGIMINNLSVCFRVIAGGIFAGLGTIFILLFNGVHIGSVAALVTQYGLGYPFWAFVFPHGSLELPAIFISGGAGLLIARGIVFPGKYKRTDAIKYYGNKAAKLVFGMVPMLVVAGIIEGFFSPTESVPDAVNYVVGMGILSAFIQYCGRKRT